MFHLDQLLACVIQNLFLVCHPELFLGASSRTVMDMCKEYLSLHLSQHRLWERNAKCLFPTFILSWYFDIIIKGPHFVKDLSGYLNILTVASCICKHFQFYELMKISVILTLSGFMLYYFISLTF